MTDAEFLVESYARFRADVIEYAALMLALKNLSREMVFTKKYLTLLAAQLRLDGFAVELPWESTLEPKP